MNSIDRRQIAEEYFKAGYNCAQSVLLAFSDLTGLDTESAAKLASSFGGGFGRMREVCGAVSGMLMAFGLIYGYHNPDDKVGKAEQYAEVQRLMNRFKAENGSYICRELLEGVSHTEGTKPEERTEAYYKKRPCAELVGCAAAILQEYIQNNGD